MALERMLSWLSSPDSEKVESKEKELRPLTEGEVASYGSHGNSDGCGHCRMVEVEGDEFVVISSSSEREDSCECSCELVDSGTLQGPPKSLPSAHRGILKTSHESKSPSLYPSHKGHCLEWRARADMPVRMKGLQAVLLNGRVLVGGGYTGNMHTEMTVYDYDPIFDMWAELPKAPTRWFGIAEFKGQLVLVGGKEAEGRGMKMTNRIAAYDDRKKEWLQPYPPMSAARSQPFVFSHAHLLAVAGGRKGILDFHVEILNGHSRQWSQATPLPAPCSPSTSLVHNGRWYLLGGRAHIHHASLEDYLTDHLRAEGGGEGGGGVGEGTGLATASTIESRDIRQGDRGHTPFWDELDPPPFTAARILSVGRHVTAFPSPTEGAGAGSTQVHQFLGSQEGWVHVGKLPSVCGSASPVRLSRGELLLFGGDVDGLHYSNKAYRVTVGCAGAQCKKRATFAA